MCDVHRLALLQQENGSGHPCRWDKPLPSVCNWLPELPQPLPTTSSSLHALTFTFALMRDLLRCTINRTHTLIGACLKPTDTLKCWLLKQQLTWETNVKGSDLLAEELLFKIRCLSNVMQSTSWNFTFLPTQHLKLLPLEPTALTPADFKGRGTGPSVPSTLLCPTYVFNSMLVKLGRAFISINSEQQREVRQNTGKAFCSIILITTTTQQFVLMSGAWTQCRVSEGKHAASKILYKHSWPNPTFPPRQTLHSLPQAANLFLAMAL